MAELDVTMSVEYSNPPNNKRMQSDAAESRLLVG